MQPTAEKPFRLQDFEPFLTRMVEEEQEGAVIGGIAVSAWAETFLLPGEKAKFDLPIYSKDLDTLHRPRGCSASDEVDRGPPNTPP